MVGFFDADELTPETAEKYINDIANKIIKWGIESPALIFLSIFSPISYMVSSTYMLLFAPFIEFFGFKAYDYVQLLRKREYIDKLISKINELSEEEKV